MILFRVCLLLLASVPVDSLNHVPLLSRSHSTKGVVFERTKAALRERDEDSLLEIDAAHTKKVSRRMAAHPEWFDDFAQGESTYTEDGTVANPEKNVFAPVRDGWNPHYGAPLYNTEIPADFFEETPSAAYKSAWQSYAPVGPGKIGHLFNQLGETGHWFSGTGSKWQQSYVGQRSLRSEDDKHLPGSWFDSSVGQIDEYGRMKYPDLYSPRRDWDWKEKSSNTTLTCNKPGCTANSSLLAPFNWNTEVAKDCSISIFFHPTDFDDAFHGEKIEWIQINGREFSAECIPRADGCNETATRPLVPCILDLPLNMAMPDNGAVTISAKISDVVDECPYKGNYLSAVPLITCMVTPKEKAAALPPAVVPDSNNTCTMEAPLRCAEKGCIAKVGVPISTECAKLGQCKLSINVTQTDYDGKDGTKEVIEYIKVGSTNASTDLKPGKNPCKSRWGGKNLTQDQLVFSALKDHALANITNKSTYVIVEAKISHYVDECASNGFLLDAMARVVCSR